MDHLHQSVLKRGNTRWQTLSNISLYHCQAMPQKTLKPIPARLNGAYTLFSRLYRPCKSREGNLDGFVRYQNCGMGHLYLIKAEGKHEINSRARYAYANHTNHQSAIKLPTLHYDKNRTDLFNYLAKCTVSLQSDWAVCTHDVDILGDIPLERTIWLPSNQ